MTCCAVPIGATRTRSVLYHNGLAKRGARRVGEGAGRTRFALSRAGAATPTAMLESVLGRIEDVNPRINALVTLDVAGAREAASAASQRWRNGTPLGSLDGVPLTVKDNLFVRGLRATWGSLLFAEHVAPQDDLPVARLRAAGAVIVGKTNTPELALAGYTDNRLFGATGNPWAPTLTPGGSSGRAVAGVSAGFGPLAVATDAGGSIRRPSGHTGVAGLKPGVGRVPRRYGFPPLAQDLQVIGLVARAIADLQLAFAAISTTQPERCDASAGRSLRIGAFGTVGDAPVDPPVTAAFAAACEALRDMGHTVEIIPAPWDREEVDTLLELDRPRCGSGRHWFPRMADQGHGGDREASRSRNWAQRRGLCCCARPADPFPLGHARHHGGLGHAGPLLPLPACRGRVPNLILL